MKAQVAKTIQTCHLQIRLMCQILPYLPIDALKSGTNAQVTSHLDYCNSLYRHISKTLKVKLQKVQNGAAHLIVGAARRDHLTPILFDRHWLPVSKRTDFRVATLTPKSCHDLGLSYP